MSDYTEWYPPEVKPVRVGVYEKAILNGKLFSCWNGLYWGSCSRWPEVAKKEKWAGTPWQSLPWRGLTREGLKRWKP